MMDFNTIERIARQLAEDRFGEGHFDRKGTKRSYWRRKARRIVEMAEAHPVMPALMRACGWPV